jgi:hypothetical protein
MIGQRFYTISSGSKVLKDTDMHMGEIYDQELVQHVRGHRLTVCLPYVVIDSCMKEREDLDR